jgi:hypothetical protein
MGKAMIPGIGRGKHPNSQKSLEPFNTTDKISPIKGKGAEDTPDGKAHRHMRSKARKYTDLALQTLVEVCEQTQNLSARVKAAEELLNRGYGRPHLQTEGREAAPMTQIKVSFGHDKEREQAISTVTGKFMPNPPKLINGEALELPDISAIETVNEMTDGTDD